MRYRKDIDGLRALSLVAVMLFHAGFEIFSGGFIGVDIFFVISGFLITSMILNEQKAGVFNVINFYERRARRIFPALFLVMFCTIPVSLLILPPTDLKDFGQSLVATSTFTSNYLFMFESSYFDKSSDLKPLLHTWSLSIEEQYYVLFPMLLVFINKFSYRARLTVLIIICLIIFVNSIFLTSSSPQTGFFAFHSRVWEILFGSIIAFILFKRSLVRSILLAEFLSFLGLILIFIGILLIERSFIYPSLYTLLPVIGTSLIILSTTKDTFVYKILSIKYIVGLGLISYSVYLWHYPILALSRHFHFGSLPTYLSLLLLLASFIFGYLSWKFIEKPFRNKTITSRNFILISSLTCILTLVLIGQDLNLNNGYKSRANFSDELMDSFALPEYKNCFNLHDKVLSNEWGCSLGVKKEKVDYILFGDSHTLPLKDLVDKLALKANISIFYAGSTNCLPFLGVFIHQDNIKGNCLELNQKILKYSLENKVKGLILSARWSGYTHGDYSMMNAKFISRSIDGPFNLKESEEAFSQGLEQTLSSYSNLGVPIHIISQPPLQKEDAESIYFKSQLFKIPIKMYSAKNDEFLDIQDLQKDLFQRLDQRFIYYDISEEFCSNNICPIGTEETSFYHDDDHLSSEGAKKLEEVLRKIFDIM